MISVEYCQLQARYNRWMNERLYAAARTLGDAQRKRDRGAFFGSIHRTLDHILWGDLTWLGRFTGVPHRHRGQVTALMKQAGVDIGPTDLPYLPGVTRVL